MSSSTAPIAVVLAAGKGTRMKADLPKVLFPIGGRPMVEYVLDALEAAGVEKIIVVVGYRSDLVREQLAHRSNLAFVEQTEQLGTGHAVIVCKDELAGHTGSVVILAGDSPLTQSSSVASLLKKSVDVGAACMLGTLTTDEPTGLGRIVRDNDGRFVGIVEEKDASDEQRKIQEVNMSTYVFAGEDLLFALDKLTNENEQREYYLTDCPAILLKAGRVVDALPTLKPCEALSINTQEQLTVVEDEMRRLGMIDA